MSHQSQIPPDTQLSLFSQGSSGQSGTSKPLLSINRNTSLAEEKRQDRETLEITTLFHNAVDPKPYNINMAALILSTIAQKADPPLLPGLTDLNVARNFLDQSNELYNLLRECLQKGSFSDIRSLHMLQPVWPHRSSGSAQSARILDTGSSIAVTVKSWSHPFQGNIDDHLYEYIKKYNDSDRYACLLPIVQSSGMGKSRLIDQFSKKHFVVPFNLRRGQGGYPAPDTAVLEWFTRGGFKSYESIDRFTAFLTALFERILKVVDNLHIIPRKIRDCSNLTDTEKVAVLRNYHNKPFPELFRDFMTVGQKWDKQGPLRVKFYAKVIKRADELYSTVPVRKSNEESPLGKFKVKGREVVLTTVLENVLKKISPSYRPNKAHPPLLCLAFDEAHTLSNSNLNYATDSSRSTAFTSLRRALRSIRPFPVWSFFLSTTGKTDQFAPPLDQEPSNRLLTGQLFNVTPFTALGFDHMAIKFDRSLTLKDVTKAEFRISLGRPLWSTRYHQGGEQVQKTVTAFAIQKLLCHAWRPDITLTVEEQFAVISHRLSLDFNTTALSGTARRRIENNEMVQVEKYMRVCLGVKEGAESVVTVAASEPILTEAAATVMQDANLKSCQVLREILQWPGMNKGDRGELITCSITIDTLDRLMFQTNQLNSESLIVPVNSYFKALFAQGIYDTAIKDCFPSVLYNGSHRKSFNETFKHSRIYLTHFIKVYDSEVLSAEFLLRLIARGAGIVCVDNQAGIDIALPMVYKHSESGKEIVSLIMKQSKNDFKFSHIPRHFLFDKMNPFDLQIFNKSDDPPPVIRMVYALASSKSNVAALAPPSRKQRLRSDKEKETSQQKGAYTSFDIWCAQASSDTFGAIRPEDNETYDALLKLSKDVTKMFQPQETSIREIVKSMYPGGSSDAGHWSSFVRLSIDNKIEYSDKQLPESESSIAGGSKATKRSISDLFTFRKSQRTM